MQKKLKELGWRVSILLCSSLCFSYADDALPPLEELPPASDAAAAPPPTDAPGTPASASDPVATAAAETPPPEAPPPAAPLPAETAAASAPATDAAPAATPIDTASVAPPPPTGETVSDSQDASGSSPKLNEFIESEKTKNFTGAPITLQVRDVDVGDVLRLIGDASGFNIILGDDAKGKLTLSLVDVPWDQALDVVLRTLHLGAERSHNILRIVSLKSLTAEKIEEYAAKVASKFTAPRVTRVFPVNYANLTDLATILQKFGSANNPFQGKTGAISGDQSIISMDSRTNSIIAHDLPENMDKIRKVIEVLDTQTPQVLIESKMIEATEDFSRALAGSLGVGGSSQTSPFAASFAGGNPLNNLLGSSGVFNGSTFSYLSTSSGPLGINNGTFGMSPSVSFLPGVSRLNALISWGENEDQVKVISSPKTVVLNKQIANIISGTPVLIPGTTTVAGVGTVPTSTVQSANISMIVAPTVTNDGSVLLNLTVSKDVPVALSGGGGQQGIGTRNMKTQVLVESGSTLVIGGIYTAQTNASSSGIPFLRKLPLIGALFGSSSESTSRGELFFFITPRILNPKEAGMSSS